VDRRRRDVDDRAIEHAPAAPRCSGSSAIGVAGIGTLFFTSLEHSGFVTALSDSLLVELATTPVLLALVSMLPKRAREEEPLAETEPAGAEPVGIAA
jgi:hypothetical protein